MRFVFLLAVVPAAFALCAAEVAPQPPVYPYWDQQESIAEYARRAHLPPTKTLDLGNGATMELMLIPAGTFLMGTPKPDPVDEDGLYLQIELGETALVVSASVLLVLLSFIFARAIREKHRPQVSLACLLLIAVVAGAGLLGGLHWRYSLLKLDHERIEYAAAVVRYKQAEESEKPAHEVTIERPFYLGKYEVTQEQYQAVTGMNPSYRSSQVPDVPVNRVSWQDANAFCAAVSTLTSEAVRLPRDAEWERACRAGTRTVYYTGDTEADLDRAGWTYANRRATKGNGVVLAVGQKVPNAWGLYDMHGNVDEWCEDTMRDQEGVGDVRVVRGGSSHCNMNCRSACRKGRPSVLRLGYTGFRVVVEAPAPRPGQ
jgi:formylglycine-generating enzyme required for sulfatase activity